MRTPDLIFLNALPARYHLDYMNYSEFRGLPYLQFLLSVYLNLFN